MIRCPRCSRTGLIKWEDARVGDDGPRELIAIEGGFYECLQKKAPYSIELVCLGCGTPKRALHP